MSDVLIEGAINRLTAAVLALALTVELDRRENNAGRPASQAVQSRYESALDFVMDQGDDDERD